MIQQATAMDVRQKFERLSARLAEACRGIPEAEGIQEIDAVVKAIRKSKTRNAYWYKRDDA